MTSPDVYWIEVGALQEFPTGQVREVIAGGRVLAMARIGEQIFALDGLCPHQGGPLGKGKLAGDVVICPWHQFSFDMKTGFCTSSRGLAQKRYEVRIEGDRVVVQIDVD
jgi:nitrite reductase/ring-hydroxylating ferredoxin subunit